MRLDSAEQINRRLKGTVVLYDDKPVLAYQASGENSVLLIPLPSRRGEFVVRIDDPRLNIQEFKLGYVNYGDRAFYVKRTPIRGARQGLDTGNLLPDTDYVKWAGIARLPAMTTLSAEFCDMLNNTYPTLRECVDMIVKSDSLVSRAFSRRFAIYYDRDLDFYELHYRGQRVGWGNPTEFNVPSGYSYLQELIKQEGINVR